MKKSLFFLAAAAVALASCSNDEVVSQNTTANQPKEIAFAPLAQNSTRAIVTGTTFTNNQEMYVTAYNTATSKDYFTNITFDGDNTNKWKGDPKQYWPLSPTTLNFIGVTGVPKANITWNTPTASSGASICWTHNGTLADGSGMYDLMYATGQGTVAYGTGAAANQLIYGNNVDMEYKHALAQVAFRVKAGDASYASQIKITKIALDGMVTAATYTLTNSDNYDDASPAAQSASGVWASTTTTNTDVPGSNALASTDLTTSFVNDGAVVVPCKDAAPTFDSFTGFKVYFTMNGSDMVYQYTPSAAEKVLTQGKKYIFDLTFNLTEIIIEPTVLDWVNNDFDGVTEGQQDKEIDIPETPAP